MARRLNRKRNITPTPQDQSMYSCPYFDGSGNPCISIVYIDWCAAAEAGLVAQYACNDSDLSSIWFPYPHGIPPEFYGFPYIPDCKCDEPRDYSPNFVKNPKREGGRATVIGGRNKIRRQKQSNDGGDGGLMDPIPPCSCFGAGGQSSSPVMGICQGNCWNEGYECGWEQIWSSSGNTYSWHWKGCHSNNEPPPPPPPPPPGQISRDYTPIIKSNRRGGPAGTATAIGGRNKIRRQKQSRPKKINPTPSTGNRACPDCCQGLSSGYGQCTCYADGNYNFSEGCGFGSSLPGSTNFQRDLCMQSCGQGGSSYQVNCTCDYSPWDCQNIWNCDGGGGGTHPPSGGGSICMSNPGYCGNWPACCCDESPGLPHCTTTADDPHYPPIPKGRGGRIGNDGMEWG